MRSFNIACASALDRTAAKTVTTWPTWVHQMAAAAKEHLPAIREIKGLDYPDFWDSPSFAHNLLEAFEGFQHQDKFRAGGNELREEMRARNDGAHPFPGHEVFSNSNGLQKLAYNTLSKHLLPEDQLKDLCEERAVKLFAPYDIFDGDGANYEEAFSVLKKVGGGIAMKVIKTWLNGWATSHRMHEDNVLCCLLGCGDGSLDSLTHYIHCPHMLAFQKFLFENISADPLIRFGIKHAEVTTLMILSCLFSAYHALKGDIRAGKINMHASGWIKNAWSVYADAIKAEAGELRLDSRAFPHPKFIDFLIVNRTYCPLALGGMSNPADNSVAHDPH